MHAIVAGVAMHATCWALHLPLPASVSSNPSDHHPHRTPSARASLGARSCNATLSRATLSLLEFVLELCRRADNDVVPARAGANNAGGALSVSHVASRAALQAYNLPTALS